MSNKAIEILERLKYNLEESDGRVYEENLAEYQEINEAIQELQDLESHLVEQIEGQRKTMRLYGQRTGIYKNAEGRYDAYTGILNRLQGAK
jgi:hypothetical protein